MTKGISAVVAVIMLLMITVALVGLAYVWTTGIFTSTTGAAGETTGSVLESISTQFVIENVRNASLTEINVSVRNTGTQNINLIGLGAYVDDKPATVLDTLGMLSQDSLLSFRIRTDTSLAGSCSHTLKLTVAGGESSKELTTC